MCLIEQCFSPQVYDTPPIVVKGPSSSQDIYDTPPSKDKNAHQMVKVYILYFYYIYHYVVLHNENSDCMALEWIFDTLRFSENDSSFEATTLCKKGLYIENKTIYIDIDIDIDIYRYKN